MLSRAQLKWNSYCA